MGKPIALLIGTIDHAQKEWDALADVAELKQLTTGTRDSFLADCKSGKYDGVVAVYRTFDSVALTGRFDDALIPRLPTSLRYICHNGAGYDQISIPACSARGISVSHTPGAVNAATANVTIMLLLSALRKTWAIESSLRSGQWRGTMELGNDPEGKILGILGMGGIGSAVASRAKGFALEVVYHNRRPVPGAPERFVPELDEFLALCDVISIHLPLSDATRHFISTPQFEKMKDGVVIINTSRGAIIDEGALVEALEKGKVGAVGLDVFEKEPEVHHGLVGRPDTVLYPHIGTATWETQRKMEVLVVENVRSAVERGGLVTLVPEQARGGKYPLARL